MPTKNNAFGSGSDPSSVRPQRKSGMAMLSGCHSVLEDFRRASANFPPTLLTFITHRQSPAFATFSCLCGKKTFLFCIPRP